MKRSLKLLIISAAYRGPGGVATHVRHLVRAICRMKQKPKISVLTVPNNHAPFESGRPQVLSHQFDPYYSGRNQLLPPGRRAPYETIVKSALDNWRNGKIKADLIHVHDQDSLLLGLLLKSAFKVPLVYTEHRAPTQWKRKKYLESAKDCFMRFVRATGLVDVFITPSKFSREVLIKQGFKRGNISVIPHGINFQSLRDKFQSRPGILSELGLNDPNIIFIFCPVRADDHKDPATFIISAPIIANGNVGKAIKFVITCQADGPFEYLARINEPGTVDLTMKQFQYEDMPTLYRRAEICVIPSIRESFGQTVLEAFAFKVPVVAANSGALPEIIRHDQNGLLFDQSSPNDLAYQVNLLLSNRGLQQRLKNTAFNDLKTQYTDNRMAEDHLAVYNKMLGKKKDRC